MDSLGSQMFDNKERSIVKFLREQPSEKALKYIICILGGNDTKNDDLVKLGVELCDKNNKFDRGFYVASLDVPPVASPEASPVVSPMTSSDEETITSHLCNIGLEDMTKLKSYMVDIGSGRNIKRCPHNPQCGPDEESDGESTIEDISCHTSDEENKIKDECEEW